MNRRDFLQETLTGAVALCFGKELLSQEKNTHSEKLYFKGVFVEADKANKNGRIYPRSVLEKAVKEFSGKATLIGELGMSSKAYISFDRVSHLVRNLRLENNNLVGEIEVLNTPCGKTLRKILNTQPGTIAFRTSGIGTLNGSIIEDFKLIGVHAVSVHDAA